MTHATRCIAALSVLLLATASINAEQFECISPHGDIGLKVVVDKAVTWSVGYQNAPVIDASELGLTVNDHPLQMLSDTPCSYLREPECTSFIARIPTTWEESKVLAAAVGEYIVMARRHGDRWYVGAMTNAEPREISITLPFLAAGSWKLEYLKDGMNAHRCATDYKRGAMQVTNESSLTISLAPGGGWAGVLEQ